MPLWDNRPSRKTVVRMTKDSPIQFKGTSLKIIQALLRTTDPTVLHAALAELTGNAPDFFENDLAVLDFTAAEAQVSGADWAGIRTLLQGSGLHAVATRGLPEELAAEAAAAGLPALAEGALGRPGKAAPAAPPPALAAPVEPPPSAIVEVPVATPAAILDKPLRSGQRFYARGSDLVVTAMVSAGAEVIADGNIHVYAPLRGRALAGAAGDKGARIFTTCLEAELVSVAGIYRTFEGGVPADLAQKPATVGLTDDGTLNVAPLAIR